MLRTILLASSLALAGTPCIAQQVRVITGDIEHVYGPGAEVLDNADLQARNQHALEHMQAEKQLAIERAQVEVEIERLKLQETAIASAMAQNWDAMAQNWDSQNWDSTGGGWFIGSTRNLSRRAGIAPRFGISARFGMPRRR